MLFELWCLLLFRLFWSDDGSISGVYLCLFEREAFEKKWEGVAEVVAVEKVKRNDEIRRSDGENAGDEEWWEGGCTTRWRSVFACFCLYVKRVREGERDAVEIEESPTMRPECPRSRPGRVATFCFVLWGRRTSPSWCCPACAAQWGCPATSQSGTCLVGGGCLRNTVASQCSAPECLPLFGAHRGLVGLRWGNRKCNLLVLWVVIAADDTYHWKWRLRWEVRTRHCPPSACTSADRSWTESRPRRRYWRCCSCLGCTADCSRRRSSQCECRTCGNNATSSPHLNTPAGNKR